MLSHVDGSLGLIMSCCCESALNGEESISSLLHRTQVNEVTKIITSGAISRKMLRASTWSNLKKNKMVQMMNNLVQVRCTSGNNFSMTEHNFFNVTCDSFSPFSHNHGN